MNPFNQKMLHIIQRKLIYFRTIKKKNNYFRNFKLAFFMLAAMIK